MAKSLVSGGKPSPLLQENENIWNVQQLRRSPENLQDALALAAIYVERGDNKAALVIIDLCKQALEGLWH